MRSPMMSFVRFGSIGSGGVALLALSGWALGNPALAGGINGLRPMPALVALGVLLLSGALVAVSPDGISKAREVLGRLVAFAAAILGLSGADVIAPNTAVIFVFLGAAIGLPVTDPGIRIVARTLGVVALVPASLAVLGYAYQERVLYGIRGAVEMSLPSSIALLFLSLGVIASLASEREGRVIRGAGASGRVSRKLLPAAVMLPPVMVAIVLAGTHQGLYTLQAAAALLVALLIGAFVALTWRTAIELQGLDSAQAGLIHDLREVGAQRDRTFDALVASDRRHRIIFQEGPTPKLLCDAATLAIVDANHAAIQNYGYSRKEILAMRFPDLNDATPDDGPARSDLPVDGDSARHRSRDGRTMDVELAVHEIDLDGRRHFLIAVMDVTENYRTVRALQDSERRFHEIADAAPAFLWTVDASGQCTFVNRAWLEFTNRTMEQELGTGWMETSHPEARQTLAAVFNEGIRRRTTYGFEWQVRRHDGEYRWVAARNVPLYGVKGEYLGTVGSGIDVTDQKNASEDLYRLNEQLSRFNQALEQRVEQRTAEVATANERLKRVIEHKSEFLASMSHELRTPLNGIIGFAELIQDGRAGPVTAEQKEYLGDVLMSGHHILRLIGGVLDLAAIEAGKLRFFPESVDLGVIVKTVVDAVMPMAHAGGISIDAWVDPRLSDVVADPMRLKQVLFNYLSNAITHSPYGSMVFVRVAAEGDDRFRIEVRDTGSGIRDADVPRLFRDFEQIGSSGTAHTGTGLGLALTRRIVEAQGGRVGVVTRFGEGSLFFASLPRAAAAVATPTAADVLE